MRGDTLRVTSILEAFEASKTKKEEPQTRDRITFTSGYVQEIPKLTREEAKAWCELCNIGFKGIKELEDHWKVEHIAKRA